MRQTYSRLLLKRDLVLNGINEDVVKEKDDKEGDYLSTATLSALSLATAAL